MAEDAAPPERLPWFKHPLVRRLPLLLVAAVGIWLFQSRGSERTVIWQLPRERAQITQLEVQLWDAEGQLLKRETFFFENGAPAEVPQKVTLPDGTYQAQVFIGTSGEPTRSIERPLTVDSETIWVNLAISR